MKEIDRRLIIVSGLSGAGKTVVLNTLEDLSYYTIDNLPISLLGELITQFSKDDSDLPSLIAIGIDARNKKNELDYLPERIKSLLDKKISTELIYIDANDEVLTKRFSETRRKHPLSSDQVSLLDAIHKERESTLEIAQASDLRVDTSFMQLNELRDIVRERIARREKAILSLQIISFGYKNGIPKDSDFVFDLRCLPNPYWKKHLRQYTGKDQPIIDFLSKQDSVMQMLNDVEGFLERWIPQFETDSRSYLSIACGCTGGHHRSVFIVERLAKKFTQQGKQVIMRHRDL
ncbi:MAG: nucleotide-binding protein [marine bacterium B5-7]|nr:MAG: nucleotide-binding protein [marine bacterium B5-7]